MDHFALFGDAQHAVDGAARRGDDRAFGLAAPAADRTAATVKKHDAHAGLLREFQQFDLGALQRPARGEDAAVLRAVGIAQHHRLLAAARLQMTAIHGVVEQCAHDFGRGAQIVDGFEQRCDIQRDFIAAFTTMLDTARRTCQRQHRQRIGSAAAHADDVRAERMRAERGARLAHGTHHRKRRLRGRCLDVDLRRAFDQRMQRRDTLCRCACGPLRIAQQRGDCGVMRAGILT